MAESRGQWGSRFGFVLAAAGSAVGLGNIWKFPYITGENGGGLFVLIYLICIALVGIPIMMAEIMIGRAAQKQPVAAFHTLQGGRSAWAGVGWLGLLAGFIILSYYIVVAGWAMDFTLKAAANFTQPISEVANLEATRYRVDTPVAEMRDTLVQRRAADLSRDPIRTIQAELRPSVWKTYGLFEAVVKGSGDPEAARAILLEEPEFRAAVRAVEELSPAIDEVEKKAEQSAIDEYAGSTDTQIRDQAETVKRRAVVFDRVQAAFLDVAQDGWTSMFWAAIFMLITILIVAAGVSDGIERSCMIMMPALLLLILAMVLYGMTTDGFGQAVSFIFKPDIHKLKPSGILEALGHSFFTLSLGMGAMITYGSYQRTKGGLLGQSVAIAGFDTLVALLACLMIFPITFAYGQEPSAGPGLVFMSMPLAFAEIGRGGMLLAIMFFSLLTFAALTSSISLLEVVASYFIDEHGWKRHRAAWTLGIVIFAFGVPSAFAMSSSFPMHGWQPSFGKNFFDTMDYLASNWMLPLGGLFIALYAGWVMPARLRDAELTGMSTALAMGWLMLIRVVAPLLVIIVLMQKVGLLDADEFFYGLVH
ncbi:MAG: sodium-dependent transporter [Phycisphaerales bacterium]|nr:sodium-dependent transporter [Phycisphaerales bacterium]